MDKMKLHTQNLTDENIARIREVFPGCVTETHDKNGIVRLTVDFDQLRQELSDHIVEGPQERYHLNWPGKRKALVTANTPIAKALRPLREKSVNFDITQNLFIEGDNLEALKLLQETYLGKIKMIYIDPPYNTGNDFLYEDDFSVDLQTHDKSSGDRDESGNRVFVEERWKHNSASRGRFHSNWLSMMYPRIRLARNLLRDDGAIVTHIDEHEYSNLEKIFTEVFGEENNLGTIIWDKRNPKGDATGVAQQHEFISIYCKNKQAFKEAVDFRRLKENAKTMMEKADSLIKMHGGVNEKCRQEYKKWLSKQEFSGGEKAYSLIDDEGEIYQTVSMAWPNKKKAPDDYFVPLIHPDSGKECPVPERGWRNPTSTMKVLLDKDQIIFGKDETTQPRRKYLLVENIKENVPSLLYFGGSDDDLFSELGLTFDNPKPIYVAKRLIESICQGNDTILDFFAGSGTAGHALLESNATIGSNLKFILIQLPETILGEDKDTHLEGFDTIADLSQERIRRAGAKILEGKYHPDWNKDVGFRVLKINTSNMRDIYYTPDQTVQQGLLDAVDNIKPDRTPEDLLFQVLVDWGVDLTLPIRHEIIQGKKVFFVDENALVACFDMGVTENLVKELARYEPLRVVFRDSGFVSDSVKINVDQIFRQLSPITDVKSI